MKKIQLLIAGILLTFSVSVFAHPISLSYDNLLTDSIKNINIYKLITAGREKEIKKYFNGVTFDELTKSDSGSIVKAFKRLSTNNKVSCTIWILEELKNRNIEIRSYVYDELLKVDYGKPSFFLNHMINNYFTNYSENEDSLSEKVRKLHGKMNR